MAEEFFGSDAPAKHHRKGAASRAANAISHGLLYVLDSVLDFVGENTRIVRRQFELFLGTALVILGFFSYHVDRFCDGNTADYLSCTRPSAYYYFDWLNITLIILGVFLIMVWSIKKSHKRTED